VAFDTSQDAYLALRSIYAERSDNFVIWAGAGISQAAGLPSWNALRQALVDALRRTAQHESSRKGELESYAIAAEREPNLWVAFKILRDKLGRESYIAAIRDALRESERTNVPVIYKKLWNLGISGILNLNIDRLATRAFNEVSGGKLLHDFPGTAIGNHAHLLRSEKPWLANLHGILDDVDSWVFTSNELERLRNSPGYLDYIKACFLTRTVVFIGISADDIAAGGYLDELTNSGVDCGGHYWITHLRDAKRAWAEQAGIRLINYSVHDGNHTELQELLDDLQSFQPSDDTPTPIAPITVSAAQVALPTPDVLEKRSAGEIRSVLNDHASRILKSTTPESISEFEEFAKYYSEAIYRAWYVSVDPPKNEILGYTLTELCAEGAFGTVFRAVSDGEQNYAVKILHERIRNNPEMLQSFRRGVNSMRILTDAQLPGVVKYYNASEIPAMVAMDFIEGLTVDEAVKKRALADWQRVLDVATWLTEIIRSSHRLPQRVLHRDIRPSNVMLENCWGANCEWQDVKLWVLDFDLSYHLEAFDVSVTQTGTANGYLAPEQADRTSGVSTRNAAVDSFGLGMTLFYLRTGIEPQFSQHLHHDWKETLNNAAINHKCSQWHSLPMRYFRLIERATRDSQSHRLDMATIDSELIRLREAFLMPSKVKSAELLAEELAARALAGYKWNSDILEAHLEVGGCTLSLRANENSLEVTFKYGWLQSENDQYPSVRKWLPRASDGIKSILESKGWRVNSTIGRGSIQGTATISVSSLTTNLIVHADAIEEAIAKLSFS
jgi:serine/threonine protein kinase